MHAITDVVAIVKEECGTTHQVTSRARVTVAPRWLGGGHPRDLHPPTVRRPSWAPPHVSLTQRKFIDLAQDPCELRIQYSISKPSLAHLPPRSPSTTSSTSSIFASTPAGGHTRREFQFDFRPSFGALPFKWVSRTRTRARMQLQSIGQDPILLWGTHN